MNNLKHTPIQINIPNTIHSHDRDCFIIDENYVPLPEGIMHAQTRYTSTFHIYEKDVIIGQALRYYGEYTQVELDVLNLFINQNSIVYDIGSNIGYHTVGFANKAKHVYAFEPNLKNLRLLSLNTQKLKNVSIYDVACSDINGDSFISDYELNDVGNYGECMMSDIGQPCKTKRIDDLNLPKPDIIKIDVEGHELKVFNGAKETIRQSKPVILYEAMHGTGFDLIYDFLVTELEYKIYWFPAMNYNPNNYKQNKTNIFGSGGVVNCLAIPKHINATVNGLEQMLSRDDTYMAAFTRIKDRYEH